MFAIVAANPSPIWSAWRQFVGHADTRLIPIPAIGTPTSANNYGFRAALTLRLRWQRLPASNSPDALPRLRVVGDAGKPPAQLDGGRQLALLFIDGTDRGGIRFGDHEHVAEHR